MQQTSLALQETLAKPQSYQQLDHVNWDNLSKTVLSHHDYSLRLLKILVGNVQRLLPNMPEFQSIVSTLSHDIIAVDETWLDLNGRRLPAEVSINGYVLHNVDKPSHSNRGGGSLIYIKEKLQPQIKTKRATEKSEIQHVNEPTRGNNILDLSINGLDVTDKIGDHQMIDFSLKVQDPNTRTHHKQVLDYKLTNFELMREELGSHNYKVLMSNKNAEECYMILKEKIATATEHHILRKRVRPTNNPPWFSQEVKRLINAIQHSYR
ncbi:hypothetical protein FHG87_004617 [Trinorchestia longiramus]|nr:hypothetical protein FHG87_004617 [Trinorchestia longiramus]